MNLGKKVHLIWLTCCIVLVFLLGAFTGRFYHPIKRVVAYYIHVIVDPARYQWPEGFDVVKIPGAKEGEAQAAYVYQATEALQARSLIVSLHTWSGTYAELDPLAKAAADKDWHYIHPNFQGANNQPTACLSSHVISDIDNAIRYALEHFSVAREAIYIVGESGGGYTALGHYLKSDMPVRSYIVWAPISDLADWYYQSRNRELTFADDILACTQSEGRLDKVKAMSRSPLHWPVEDRVKNKRLHLFAGMNDGYDGSVPISHSINFYNKISRAVDFNGALVDSEERDKLLTKAVESRQPEKTIENRAVIFQKKNNFISLLVFDGGHEMLVKHTLGLISSDISKENDMDIANEKSD